MHSAVLTVVAVAAVLACVARADYSDPVVVNIDSQGFTTPLPHFWKRCVGSGHTLLGTRVDWRAHLQRARDELGFEGIRMHGIFDDDMSVAPDVDPNTWSFYNVDLVYDFIVQLGMKPIVELSFMPRALANCTKDCPYAFDNHAAYKGIVYPPRDYNQWYDLVRATVQHFVDRYGLGEVASWHFEVWNELWGVDYPHDYIPLYNASARAIKDVHSSLKVGGPATMQLQYLQDFITDTKTMNLPVDFVSSHLYPTDPQCVTEAPGKDDQDCFAHHVQAARDLSAAAGLPFFLTEYNDGLEDGYHRDRAYGASFVIRNVGLLDKVDLFSWWTFTDVFEEQWLTGVPFQNGFGLLTTQGVAKPVYRAFQLLHGAGDQRLQADVRDPMGQPSNISVMATQKSGTTTKTNDLQIFIANFSPEDQVTGHPVAPVTRTITLTVANMPPFAEAVMTRIDDTFTNPEQLWASWGSPRYLTASQIEILNAASKPQSQPVSLDSNGTLTFTVPAYGVVHLHFFE